MPGRADLVDGLRGDLLGDPALDLRLARGDLPLAGLQDLPVGDGLDLLGIDAGALEGRLDRLAAEVGRLERGEGAAHLPEGRAGGREDHGLGHVGLLRKLRGVRAGNRSPTPSGPAAARGGTRRTGRGGGSVEVSARAVKVELADTSPERDRRRPALRRALRRRGAARLPGGRARGRGRRVEASRASPSSGRRRGGSWSSASASATTSTPSGPASPRRSASVRRAASNPPRSPGSAPRRAAPRPG